MRRAVGGKKRDANEAQIVSALRAVGAYVQHLSGSGAPDLLCCFRDRWVPMEVKSEKGRRTEAQQATRYPIVRSAEDGLRLIGALR